jgi:peptidoglycan hydrolase CwlO-like protein
VKLSQTALILTILATAGCDTPMSKAERAIDLSDAANANARSALSQVQELESENEKLESEIDNLKNQISNLESDISSLKRDNSLLFSTVDNNARAYNKHLRNE